MNMGEGYENNNAKRIRMTANLLQGIACTAKPVLDEFEQTLYNLCEDYFVLQQVKTNRFPILSQVRLVDVIEVDAPNSYINNIQFNAMSFDIVITDSEANPIFIFEADGDSHKKPERKSADELKDAIAEKAGIPLFRVEVDGIHTHLDVVRADAANEGFTRQKIYRSQHGLLCYTLANFPDSQRLIEIEDLELLLIKAGWQFPAGWVFKTRYDFRGHQA